jgi:hypothetical protein
MNIKSYTEWVWKGAGLNPRALKFDEGGWPVLPTSWVNSPEQGFIKFFGRGNNRLDRSSSIIDEVRRAGCHWACTYSKAPRQPRDGAIIFMGRYIEPDDVLIFGRAHGMQYVEGRDQASQTDLDERPWKKDWPVYIRVISPEFIDGEFSHGVSLNELMAELWSETFATTSRRAAESGKKDINPKDSLAQQTQLELTPRAIRRLSDRLEQRFEVHGKISKDDLAKLDWPTI